LISDYAAGLFDGEGCVQAHAYKNGNFKVLLEICMDDPRGILMLHEHYGGSLLPFTRDTDKTNWRWRIHGSDADAFCADMLSSEFCVCKREQLKLFQQLRKLMNAKAGYGPISTTNRKRRVYLCNRIKAEKRRTVAV
jgi:hypothetical protein